MLDKDTLARFEQIKISELSRKDVFGSRSFDEILPILKQIYDMIKEEIVILQAYKNFPEEFIHQVNSRINELHSFNTRIKKIDFDTDASRNFDERNSIIRDIRTYYNEIINVKNNFLPIYTSIKLIGIQDVEEASKKYTEFKKEIEREITEIRTLEQTLRTEATKETLSDYAEIFEKQARIHSNFKLKNKTKFSPKFGAAERWLSIGIILIILLLIVLFIGKDIFNINYDDPTNSLPQIIQKIAVLAVLIYLIRFSLKQFSINKHLFTLNKHRENVLNSFKIFIASISKDDLSVRNTLMLSVAKAIYEQNKSGYLNEKGDDNSSPSIIELTKLISNKENS